jgi:hypothetical protein
MLANVIELHATKECFVFSCGSRQARFRPIVYFHEAAVHAGARKAVIV